jgi:hypothetical protein
MDAEAVPRRRLRHQMVKSREVGLRPLPDCYPLPLRQPDVVAGFGLHRGQDGLLVPTDVHHQGPPGLDASQGRRSESQRGEKFPPAGLVGQVGLHDEGDGPAGPGGRAQRIHQFRQLLRSLPVHQRTARHVGQRPQPQWKGSVEDERAGPRRAVLQKSHPPGRPAEGRLQLTPLRRLEDVGVGVRGDELVPLRRWEVGADFPHSSLRATTSNPPPFSPSGTSIS